MTVRSCVFCGAVPKDKNREHVIPQWLIELTGDPNRRVRLGLLKRRSGFELREYSFGSFVFPSCTSCNQEFAALEGQVREIVLALLRDQFILGSSIPSLLNWFDKVRVGIWLGHRALDRNIYGIEPKFFIKQRLGYHDRMVAIYWVDSPWVGLGFAGTDVPVFAYTPSCFALRINNLYFVNMSFDFFLSRRFGLPYPSRRRLRPDGRTEHVMAKGSRRVATPILVPPLPGKPLILYQPIRPPGFSEIDSMYECEHARSLGLFPPNRRGAVFAGSETGSSIVSTEAKYRPSEKVTPDFIVGPLTTAVMNWQLTFHSALPSLELLPKAVQRRLRAQSASARRVQMLMIRKQGAA